MNEKQPTKAPMKMHTLADLLAAQKTLHVEMTDKSGNRWEFEMSPLCARIVDAMDRTQPLPLPQVKRGADGKPERDEAGAPVMDTDPAWMRSWLNAQATRTKAAVAAAIGPDWFGARAPRLPEQIAALEDLFDYAELSRAARIVKGEAIVTEQDVAEARHDTAPFGSTSGAEQAAP